MTTLADIIPKLKEVHDLELLMRHQSRNTYVQKGDDIIGLNLCETNLGDDSLGFLKELPHLQALNLSGNDFTTLVLPDKMEALQQLDCSDCPKLKNLQLPAGLQQLQHLDVSDVALERLVLPDRMPELMYLDASRNQLTTLVLPNDCMKLKYIDLANNKITHLEIAGDFNDLEYLFLPNNGMGNLEIKSSLPKIKILNLDGNKLERLPQHVILEASIKTLYAHNNLPKNIPSVFLGGNTSANCLEDARIWFAEIRDFPSDKNFQVKLMITGNGDTGKSTLYCALQNGKCTCEDEHKSTHAIQIGNLAIGKVQFNIWDFAGQEIYHGTHRLFMESPAVQVLVFDPATEERARLGERKKDRVSDELVLDHRIEYWYDTVKALSPDSPFIFVQNKSDKFANEDDVVRKTAKEKEAKFIHVSAKRGNEIDELELLLKKAAAQLPEFEMLMPSSWLEVRKYFTDNLLKAQPEKTITESFFLGLCKNKKVNERTIPLLFRYLHHGGYLFHHEKLGDTIIVDQKWALEAIYKLFDRNAKHFDRRKKRKLAEIPVYEIFEIFGSNYSEEQKKLFLQFMESCGICFKLNKIESTEEFSEIDSYVFPEFLPDTLDVALEAAWNERTKNVLHFRYKLSYPNYPKFLAFITALGRKTDIKNIWRNGIKIETQEGWFRVELDYDTPSIQLFIEQKATGKWLKTVLKTLAGGLDWGEGWEQCNKENKWTVFPVVKVTEKEDILQMQGQEPDESLLEEMNDVVSDSRIQRVLFVSANPASTKKLSVSNEFAHISQAVDTCPTEQCKLEPKIRDNISLPKLIDYIKKIKPHFVHFVGHGQEEGETGGKAGLIFHSDDFREEEVLGSEELKRIFQNFKKRKDIPLHTIYLNACLSALEAKAISEAGFTVLGADGTIQSVSARRVAAKFYETYCNTLDVAKSLDEGLEYGVQLRDKFKLYQNGKEITI